MTKNVFYIEIFYIEIFVLAFWSFRKNALTKKVGLISKLMMSQPG